MLLLPPRFRWSKDNLPDGPLELDPDFPYIQNLKLAYFFHDRRKGYNLVDGVQATVGSSPVTNAERYGWCESLDSNYDHFDTNIPYSGNEWTLLIFQYPRFLPSGGTTHLAFRQEDNLIRFGWDHSSSSQYRGSVYFKDAGGTYRTASFNVISSDIGKWGAYVGRAISGTGLWAFKNGRLESETLTSGTFRSPSGDMQLGSSSSKYLDTNLSVCCVWNAALPDELIFELSQNPFILLRQPRLWIPSFVPTVGSDYTLIAESGSVAFTGQATTLSAYRLLSAESGSISLSGQASSLLVNRILAADSGSLSLNGQALLLLAGRLLGATQGLISLSGQDAGLSYSGESADYTLTAEPGSISISGQAATILARRILSVAQGTFSLSGQEALLLAGRLLSAGGGSVSISGQESQLLARRLLSAAQGSIALIGREVTLTYSGAVAADYTLTAESGTISISGQTANLLANRVLHAGSGIVSLTGEDAEILVNRLLSADSGTISLLGQDADMLVSRLLVASQGVINLGGQTVVLVYSGTAPVITPEDRIFVVDPQSRVYVVTDDDRTYVISI